MELTLPRLTQTMESARVLEWLRVEGEPVRKGEALLVVETDKAAVEIEAPVSGLLGRVAARVGEVVPVGGLLCIIQEREEVSQEEKVKVSPLARRLAQEHDLDLGLVRGSGPGGRIVREDVLGALEGRPAPPKPPTPLPPSPPGGMRRAIAQQMALSARTAARVTLFMEVDMNAAVALREELASSYQSRYQASLTPTHLVIAAAARALREHPHLNARWSDEGFQVVPQINIGIAVALEEGLVVPVLRVADGLSLLQIALAEARLTDRARGRTLSAEEFSGGSFTVTNLGMYGVDGFTPIINPPEAAILGVGRLAEKAAVREGQVVPRWLMELCLSFDHRIVDGAPAAAFLARVKELLEKPELLPVE